MIRKRYAIQTQKRSLNYDVSFCLMLTNKEVKVRKQGVRYEADTVMINGYLMGKS